MRLLFVAETLGRGGAELALINTVPVLQRRGHHCEVLILMEPYEFYERLQEAGVVVHRLDLHGRGEVWKAVLKIADLCRRQSFDVIHAHLSIPGIAVALSRPWASGPKRVITYHNLGFDSYPAKTLWQRCRKRVEGWMMRRLIDDWIGVSSQVVSHYRQHFGLSGGEIVFNALPSLDCPPQQGRALLASYGADPAGFVAIVPGRLVPEKGHRVLLSALELLREGPAAFTLLIFGDGPLQETLVNEVQARGLASSVKVHEALLPEDLFAVIVAADMVVIPSVSEGFGMVAAEAQWLGAPLVSTTAGGLAEIVDHDVTALAVPPNDPGALADAIERMRNDAELRSRLANAGRESARKRFSPAMIAKQLESFYHRALGADQQEGTNESAG